MEITNLTDIILEFHQRLSAIEKSALKESGLTHAQADILNIVRRFGSLRMKDLAVKKKISKCTLTVSINRLEKKEFLKRVPSEQDKRVILIQLTEKGYHHLNQHHELHKKWVFDQTTGLSEKERDHLVCLYNKIIGECNQTPVLKIS